MNRYRRYTDYDVWMKSLKYNEKCEKNARQNPISVTEIVPSVENPRLYAIGGEFGVKILVENSLTMSHDGDYVEYVEIELDFQEALRLAKLLQNRAKLGKNTAAKLRAEDHKKPCKE